MFSIFGLKRYLNVCNYNGSDDDDDDDDNVTTVTTTTVTLGQLLPDFLCFLLLIVLF